MWQITALLPAERAGSDDPRIGHGFDRRRNVLVTPFANDHERIETGRRSVKHKRQYWRTKGEYVKTAENPNVGREPHIVNDAKCEQNPIHAANGMPAGRENS